MSIKYCYSTNGENFDGDFDSREEAIYEAVCLFNLEVGQVVFTAESAPISARQLIRADHVIDNIQCAAADLAGEAGADYLSCVSTEHMYELESIISEWMERVDPVYFFGVIDSKEHVLTLDMIDEAKGGRHEA